MLLGRVYLCDCALLLRIKPQKHPSMNPVVALPYDIIASLQWVVMLMFFDFTAVIIAAVCDLVSALRRVRRNGMRRTSRGYRRTVDKLVRYFITLMSLAVVDALLIASALFLRSTMQWDIPVFPLFTTLGALCLTLIEAKSVMENTQRRSDMTDAAKAANDLLNDPALQDLADTLRRIIGK